MSLRNVFRWIFVCLNIQLRSKFDFAIHSVLEFDWHIPLGFQKLARIPIVDIYELIRIIPLDIEFAWLIPRYFCVQINVFRLI